jgi:UDP-N-acetyl-D-glucosamine dehydrogenase
VMHLLQQKGALVEYSDPYVAALPASSWPGERALRSVEMTAEALRGYDCVVVVTDHRAFDYRQMVTSARLIVDSRNAIGARAPHVFRLGAPCNATPAVEVVS